MAFCGRKDAIEALCVAKGDIVVLSACTGKETLNCEAAAPTVNPNEESERFVRTDEVISDTGGMTVVTVALTAGAEVLTLKDEISAGGEPGTGDMLTLDACALMESVCSQIKADTAKRDCGLMLTQPPAATSLQLGCFPCHESSSLRKHTHS